MGLGGGWKSGVDKGKAKEIVETQKKIDKANKDKKKA